MQPMKGWPSTRINELHRKLHVDGDLDKAQLIPHDCFGFDILELDAITAERKATIEYCQSVGNTTGRIIREVAAILDKEEF